MLNSISQYAHIQGFFLLRFVYGEIEKATHLRGLFYCALAVLFQFRHDLVILGLVGSIVHHFAVVQLLQ